MRNQILAILLAACMVFTIFPVQALAAESESPSDGTGEMMLAEELNASGKFGAQGDNLTWTLENGTLTISGTGAMPKFLSDSAPWYDHRFDIKKVVIQDGVTSIGRWAFSKYSNLVSVSIPNSVTSIEQGAFMKCTSLSSVVIPDSVKDMVDNVFDNCSSMTSVTIGNGVKSIGRMAFVGCKSLFNVTIGNSVESIGEAAFSSCSSLTHVTIPDSVFSIGETAFGNCSDLTSVTIGNGVTSIGNGAFHSCVNLESVTIPASVTSIGATVFGYCSSLTHMTIPDSVTSIGAGAFLACEKLTEIKVAAGNTTYFAQSDILFEKRTNGTALLCYPAGLGGEYQIPSDVISIEKDAFSYSSLTHVTIPDSVTSIGENAFSHCTNLEGVIIPASVTSIGNNAFSFCHSMRIVTFVGDPPTSIDGSPFDSRKVVRYPHSRSSNWLSPENPLSKYELHPYLAEDFQLTNTLTSVPLGSTSAESVITIGNPNPHILFDNDWLQTNLDHFIQDSSTGLKITKAMVENGGKTLRLTLTAAGGARNGTARLIIPADAFQVEPAKSAEDGYVKREPALQVDLTVGKANGFLWGIYNNNILNVQGTIPPEDHFYVAQYDKNGTMISVQELRLISEHIHMEGAYLKLFWTDSSYVPKWEEKLVINPAQSS